MRQIIDIFGEPQSLFFDDIATNEEIVEWVRWNITINDLFGISSRHEDLNVSMDCNELTITTDEDYRCFELVSVTLINVNDRNIDN